MMKYLSTNSSTGTFKISLAQLALATLIVGSIGYSSAEAATVSKPTVEAYGKYYKNKAKAVDSAHYRWGLKAAAAHGASFKLWGKARSKNMNCAIVPIPESQALRGVARRQQSRPRLCWPAKARSRPKENSIRKGTRQLNRLSTVGASKQQQPMEWPTAIGIGRPTRARGAQLETTIWCSAQYMQTPVANH